MTAAEKMLLQFLNRTSDPNAKVILLQNFIAGNGPLSEEAGVKVRELLRFKDSDIVEQLRHSNEWAHCKHPMREIERLRAELDLEHKRLATSEDLRTGLAAEIERLRAERAELLAALQEMIKISRRNSDPELMLIGIRKCAEHAIIKAEGGK